MLECNLQKLLAYKGVSQKRLSEVAGVSVQTIHTWIKGKNVPALDSAYKVAEFLGCSVYDIWKLK